VPVRLRDADGNMLAEVGEADVEVTPRGFVVTYQAAVPGMYHVTSDGVDVTSSFGFREPEPLMFEHLTAAEAQPQAGIGPALRRAMDRYRRG
jgi:hypothetical protein